MVLTFSCFLCVQSRIVSVLTIDKHTEYFLLQEVLKCFADFSSKMLLISVSEILIQDMFCIYGSLSGLCFAYSLCECLFTFVNVHQRSINVHGVYFHYLKSQLGDDVCMAFENQNGKRSL